MPRSAPALLPFAGHGVLVAPDRLKLLNPAAAEIQAARAAGVGEEGILAALVAAGLAESAARAHLLAVAQALADLEQPPIITPFPPQLPPAIYQAPPPLPATTWSGCLALCGCCYRVRTDDPILAATLVPLLAHLLLDQPVEIPPQATLSLILDPGQNTRTLWRGAHPLATGLARDTALPTLLMDLGECAYRGSDWLAALHAGGVHDGRRALVLPALGGTGKTTLTAALLAAGLGYLSDDVIPLKRRTCEAMALALPLRVRAASLPLLRASFLLVGWTAAARAFASRSTPPARPPSGSPAHRAGARGPRHGSS